MFRTKSQKKLSDKLIVAVAALCERHASICLALNRSRLVRTPEVEAEAVVVSEFLFFVPCFKCLNEPVSISREQNTDEI